MRNERALLLSIPAIIAILLATRLTGLNRFTTADEKRWLANTKNFTENLALGKVNNLFQQAHPGITTQWLAAPAVYYDSWSMRKMPLIIGQIVLLLATIYFAYRLWGTKTSLMLGLLLALDPVLIAHMRVYAMDSLLAIFILLSILSLLLWKKSEQKHYLIYSAIAGAAAVLSKLSGIIIIPLMISFVFWFGMIDKKSVKRILWAMVLWVLVFLAALPIILPSLATNTSPVLQDMLGFFSSTDYQELHPAGNAYYLRTLIFFSTPLMMVSLLLLPFVWQKLDSAKQKAALFILFSAVAFVVMMTLGAKKGDRYILPVFLWLDVVGAFVIAVYFDDFLQNKKKLVMPLMLAAILCYQAVEMSLLHPYYLAYINPITKPWFGDRRLGWGEGLDLAAAYLNQKPQAAELKVASYYPVEFGEKFVGQAVPLHNWEDEDVDYAILYRAQFERGDKAWETDVLDQFSPKYPEHKIMLNGLEYAWIFNLRTTDNPPVVP